MKKIIVAGFAGLIMAGLSAYADDNSNIAQERHLQKSNGFNGTAQSVRIASKRPIANTAPHSSSAQGDQQYNFSHRNN